MQQTLMQFLLKKHLLPFFGLFVPKYNRTADMTSTKSNLSSYQQSSENGNTRFIRIEYFKVAK